MHYEDMSLMDLATLISTIFAGTSAAVAAAAIYFPWRTQKNQEILAQAVLSIERAYDALSNNKMNVKPPIADRLNWLTCARHIESYKSLKKKIKTNLHLELCNEHEEYWRHQFYLCLDIPNIHYPGYYSEKNSSIHKASIEPNSALIIYAFASWPKEKNDPIDSVDIKKLIDDCDPLKGNIGLSQYIQSLKIF